MDRRVCPQHLKGLRSDYVMYFLKNYYKDFPPDPIVVDLGTGRWRHATLLKCIGLSSVICIDKTLFPNKPTGVKFLLNNLERGIPLKNDTVNIILCCYLMMFIKNRDLLIKEITRVAHNGAFLVLELNEKPLANGFIVNYELILKGFIDEGWLICHQRKRPVGRSLILTLKR